MKIIDISRDLLSAELYPGDPAPRAERLRSMGVDASDCNVSAIYTCVHTGTHVDAPSHFIEGGATIGDCPLDAFIGPCRVIEVRGGPITGENVNNFFPRCERLLVKGRGRAYFMDSAAQEAAALGIKLIGTDALSVGTKGDQLKPHKAFLQSNVALLEGLCLDDVPAGEYYLFAPPVRLDALEGAPARAVLIDDYIFWGGRS